MDRFSQHSAFSKASNLILNQGGIPRGGARDAKPGSGLATPSGYMSGTQYQLLKDAKASDFLSKELRTKRERPEAADPHSSRRKTSPREGGARIFDHSKTLVRKKGDVYKTLERHDETEDRDERQIKSEIDYTSRKSYYAPSTSHSKRATSAASSQLSRANVRQAFGSLDPPAGGGGERSVTARSARSVYSRPTTSAAMSVVSASSYYSYNEGKRASVQHPSDSIVESDEQDEDDLDISDEDSQEGSEGEDGQDQELAKAEREERKRRKAQRKKRREERKRKKLEQEKRRREAAEEEALADVEVPDGFSQSFYRRQQIKTAGVQEPRKWKHGLGEKLKEKDYGDDSARKDKINRRMNKEREKALVGQRLKKENDKILSDMRSSKTNSQYSQRSTDRGTIMSKPRLVPRFSKSLRISSGIIRDQQIPESYAVPMVSSSHSTHSDRIFDNLKVDKLNFKRLNMFGAYVNAAFKGGVFHGAPTDSA